MQTRQQIIDGLKSNLAEAECERISRRLLDCNVRAVYSDGHTEISNLRNRHAIANAMEIDESIAHFEYNFNQKWVRCVAF